MSGVSNASGSRGAPDASQPQQSDSEREASTSHFSSERSASVGELREPEMELIAEFISTVLAAPDNDGVAATVREKIEALCRKFPLYPESRS